MSDNSLGKTEKKKIYLCDLSHVTHEGLVSEFVPVGIGCLKSYFMKYSNFKDKYEISLFKHPETFTAAFTMGKPDIVGFSNYCWNLDLSYTFADEIKNNYPETLIIFGGPNYPLDNSLRESWLIKRKAIDVYIVGEAEESFTKIVESWNECKSAEGIKKTVITGCQFIVNDKLTGDKNNVARLRDLDCFDSPYTSGYLDEFLDKGLIPIVQTNRGCPFTCTFCEKGSRTWSRITHRLPELFEQELIYIAQKSKGKLLVLCDNNYGFFAQDVQSAKILESVQKKYDYPYYISASTSKVFNEYVQECLKILGKSLPVTASVQSLDEFVLKNIKRKNMPLERYIEISENSRTYGNISRSEVILGLPGDTKEKHKDTICKLMDAGMQFVLPYTLILLDGSELNTLDSRKAWDLQTRYRLNHRCYGKYSFLGKELVCSEIEEVVVGSASLTMEEYFECRRFDLTVSIFYSDDMLNELLGFIANFGIKPSTFLMAVEESSETYFSENLCRLYESFDRSTREELWVHEEEPRKFAKAKLESKTDSKDPVGLNILFYHRAVALADLVDDVIEVAFKVVEKLFAKNIPEMWTEYLNELKIFMRMKRVNFFNYDLNLKHDFSYDFIELAKGKFNDLPKKLPGSIELMFIHDDEQKEIFKSFGKGIDGAMRIIPRVGLPGLLRFVEKA